MKIIKRNGQEADFDLDRIVKAVTAANKEVPEYQQMTDMEILCVADNAKRQIDEFHYAVSVEEIQDIVERQIMKFAPVVAQTYIRYRHKRELARQANTTDAAILSLLDYENEEVKQENSNKNPVVASVQRDYMAGEVSKDLSRRVILPKDVVEAHDKGIIHFHDMDYFSQHIFNCFDQYTKFITDKGIKSFRDFRDGDVVYVKDMNGDLRKATVRCYGRQRMNIVTLKNMRMTRTFTCTPNHRWILDDGTITTELKVGDKLWMLQDSTEYTINTTEEAWAFCLGFAIGDGYDNKIREDFSRWGGKLSVRLCGNKTKYVEYFKMAGFKITKMKETEDLWCTYNGMYKQDFLNGHGWRFMDINTRILVFHGFYAADGSVDTNRLSTADERVAEFVNEVAGLAGYFITSTRVDTGDTEYKKGRTLINFHFRKRDLLNQKWTVESIEKKTDKYGKWSINTAWCVEEPITHSFTLDGGIITGNCCLINLEDMLQNGTVISGVQIDKPKSFQTACTVATQIISTVASNQYGGQSVSLSHLAPFVEVSRQKWQERVRETLDGVAPEAMINELAENLLYKECEAGMQTIQYQVITLMTTNGQAPFITVEMYLGEVKDPQTKKDLAMLIEIMLKQRILGVKNEKGIYITPAFPKIVYVLEEDNASEGSPYWYLTELAAKCTAKRMVPDYVSEKIMLQYKIDENGEGHCYPPMGCRSFLTPYVDKDGKPKYFGRFNQGVVTINLPDVALSSGGDMEKFWNIFEERLELCHKALKCRHERLKGTLSDVSPIHWQYGAIARIEKGKPIDEFLYGGYSTISLGYAGLFECVKYMTGESHTSEAGKPFALEVMQKLNDKCAEWKAAENIAYSVYGTPLESTTYKFAKALQRRFGIIKDVTDHNYITNSYHVNVREEIDAFSKLSFESEFQRLSPGGAISYIEVPDMQDNIPAVLDIIKFIYDNIMYAELNTKSDYCQECGWDGQIEIVNDESGKLIWKCPNCGNTDQSKMNVARRTCGYIGTQFWNQGRTQEIKDRVVHVGVQDYYAGEENG